jgi:hypothetical protein
MGIIMGGVCDQDHSSVASTRGPSALSRVILGMASLFNALNEMPADFWVKALRSSAI